MTLINDLRFGGDMAFLKAFIRWGVAIFFGMAALGTLLSGHVLGASIMLAGCAIIAPPGGAWLKNMVAPLRSGLRQVVLGVGMVVVGVVVGTTANMDKAPAPVASAQPAADSPSPPVAPPPPKFLCEQGTAADGIIVDVMGSKGHLLRKAPNGEKIINQKATDALGSPQYQMIDNSTKVQLQCADGNWARVQVVKPEWLKGHVGWVERSALAQPLMAGEFREFTEADFLWDNDTAGIKPVIIKAVNRIHQEDPRCREAIYPSSVAKSSMESKAQKKAVFFVNCGEGTNSVNVYFDAKRADDPTPFRAPGHIDQTRAIELCEAYSKANATHPSTVDFSRFMDLAISEHPNGRTQVISSFTAKNSFNLELKFRIRCLFDENGMIEANISEAG